MKTTPISSVDTQSSSQNTKALALNCEKSISCPTTHYNSGSILTKIFVGGIHAHINKEDLKQHFQKYGEITYIKLAINYKTNCNKGYSFLTFKDLKSVNQIIDEPQIIGGRKVDCKISLSGKHNKEDKIKECKTKIFFKKLHTEVLDQELTDYFQQFGQIKNAYSIYDHGRKVRKGFGYIEFVNESSVARTLTQSHFFRGKKCEVEKYKLNPKKDKIRNQKDGLKNLAENPAIQEHQMIVSFWSKKDEPFYYEPYQQYQKQPNFNNQNEKMFDNHTQPQGKKTFLPKF